MGHENGIIDKGLDTLAHEILGGLVDVEGEFVLEKILKKRIAGVQFRG